VDKVEKVTVAKINLIPLFQPVGYARKFITGTNDLITHSIFPYDSP
jgi:hypothetical protein